MGKKLNKEKANKGDSKLKDGDFITRLYISGEIPINIARKYKFSKQKVNYWIHKYKNGIQNKGTRKRKLDEKYLKYIEGLARHKTTSFMGARKITSIINKRLAREGVKYKIGKKKGKILTIGKTMVTEFLKEKFGAPRKLKKVFYLDERQRGKRLEFCKQMIEKQIKGEDIFLRMKQELI